MQKTSLITGVTGQDGSYLAELLLDKGYKVFGLVRRCSTDNTGRISHLLNNTNFEIIQGDITDCSCMHKIISGIKPNEVYNLAAMSHVGTSFTEPISTCHVNAICPLNILEAIRQTSPDTKFYQASTSELFGDTKTAPQSETTPLNPNSPYAVAKAFAHHTVALYRRAYGIFACAGILFNHESPRRGADFVTRKITQYVADLLVNRNIYKYTDNDLKKLAPLKMGNVSARRDWSHAKDMVRGMWLMMQYSKPDDYVLGSGTTHTVREFLELAFGLYKMNYEDYFVVDPKFYRPVDVNLLQADATKSKETLGWQHEISFEDMVREMIDNDYDELVQKIS